MKVVKLELRKIRPFGENISDTFQFIRLHFGSLIRNYFAICGIFILIVAIGAALMGHDFSRLINFYSLTGLPPTGSHFLKQVIFFGVVPGWIALVAVGVMVNSYMLCYDSQPGIPAVPAVWKVFRKYYLRVLFSSFPVTFLILGGMIFCIVPGIYLSVVLTNYICITVIEDVSLGTMFNRCFTLIRNNLWSSLAIYLIIYLIAGLVELIPFGILAATMLMLSARDHPVIAGLMLSALSILRLLFYVIPMIAVALNYFTLTERVNGLGLIRRNRAAGPS
jgi:hypothetical protein